MNFKQSALAITISAFFLPGMVAAATTVTSVDNPSNGDVLTKITTDDINLYVSVAKGYMVTTDNASPAQVKEVRNTAGKVTISDDKSQKYEKAGEGGAFSTIMTLQTADHGDAADRVKLAKDGSTIIVLDAAKTAATKAFNENGVVEITTESDKKVYTFKDTNGVNTRATIKEAEYPKIAQKGSAIVAVKAPIPDTTGAGKIPSTLIFDGKGSAVFDQAKNEWVFKDASDNTLQTLNAAQFIEIKEIKEKTEDGAERSFIIAKKALPEGATAGATPETLVFDSKGSAAFSPTTNVWTFKAIDKTDKGTIVIDAKNNSVTFNEANQQTVAKIEVKDDHILTTVGQSTEKDKLQPITDENKISIYKSKKEDGKVIAIQNKEGSIQFDPDTGSRIFRDAEGGEVDKLKAIKAIAEKGDAFKGAAIQEYARYLAEQSYGASRTYTNTEMEKAKTEVTTGYTRQVDNLGGRVDNLSKKVDDNEKKAKAGIAGAMAMSAIPQRYGYDFSFGMGVATYGGEQSVAAGAYYNISSNTTLSVKASVDTQDDVGGAVGVSFGW